MNICPLILNLSILKSWPVSDEVSDEVIKCMCLQFDQSDSSMFWRHTEAPLWLVATGSKVLQYESSQTGFVR